MSHSATLQIVNATNFKLSNTYSHEYQMVAFSFADVDLMDYKPFTIDFYDGHHDEDDGAEATYAINDDSGNPQFTIQFASHNYESLHYISVKCLSDASSKAYVVVTSGNGGVINPTSANDLYWYLFEPNANPDDPANPDPHATSANDPAAYFIGYVNDAVMGLGIIDLNVLFPPQVSTSQTSTAQKTTAQKSTSQTLTAPTSTPNPNVATYSTAIKNGLSANQKTALSNALNVLFPVST
jgi:hypothetical protein